MRAPQKHKGAKKGSGRAIALFAAAALFALIVGSSYFFLIAPLLQATRPGGDLDLTALAREAETKEAELERGRLLLSSVQSLGPEARAKLESAIPSTQEVPELIALIETIVQVSGLKIQALEITPQKDGLKAVPEAGVLGIALGVGGGDYFALQRLLTSLEHSLRIIDVLGVSFNTQTASYTISARTYYLRDGGR